MQVATHCEVRKILKISANIYQIDLKVLKTAPSLLIAFKNSKLRKCVTCIYERLFPKLKLEPRQYKNDSIQSKRIPIFPSLYRW